MSLFFFFNLGDLQCKMTGSWIHTPAQSVCCIRETGKATNVLFKELLSHNLKNQLTFSSALERYTYLHMSCRHHEAHATHGHDIVKQNYTVITAVSLK